MKSIQKYLDIIEKYTPVTPEKAEELVAEQNGSIIFLARETCPYCRKMVGKLNQAAEEKDLTIYYLDTGDIDHIENTAVFRQKYDIATVPSLVYSDENGVKTVSDSSLKKDEILEFFHAQY